MTVVGLGRGVLVACRGGVAVGGKRVGVFVAIKIGVFVGFCVAVGLGVKVGVEKDLGNGEGVADCLGFWVAV